MEEYLSKLDFSLRTAVDKLPQHNLGILFSGGLDSALLTKYIIDTKRRPVLYSCGVKGLGDLDFIKEAASNFKLEHKVLEISTDALPQSARKI